MANLEVSSAVMEYKWKGTPGISDTIQNSEILSDVINFFEEDSFQASFKMTKNSIQNLRLKAAVNNLSKMGFSVDQVLVSAGSLPNPRSMIKDDTNEPTESKLDFSLPGVFSFSHQNPEKLLRQGDRFTTFDFEFNFKIYITATAKEYRIGQVDSFMIDHLWSAATKRTWTDFELIAHVDNKSFWVHKFVLAARSPVFASLFSKDPAASSQTDFVDSTSMEQFIKFLYTGQLVGLVCGPYLWEMASKYQLPTLQKLCISDRSHQSKMSKTVGKNTLIKSEGGEPKIDNPSTTSAVILSWDLNWVIKDTTLGDGVYSKSFNDANGREMYRVKAKLSRKKPDSPLMTMVSADGVSKSLHVYKLKISITCPSDTQHLPKKGRLINKVGFKICMSSGDWNETKFTEKIQPSSGSKFTDKEILKRWELTTCKKASIPLRITFYVEQMTTIPNYDFTFIDATWSDQLWTAALKQSFTDFKFLIGDEFIAAHRFILSARSPVFAAMLDSGMTESQTGQMRIVDDDPSTFRHLLEFLYTGMVPSTADREKLFLLADKYGVENLMALCHSAVSSGKDDKEDSEPSSPNKFTSKNACTLQ